MSLTRFALMDFGLNMSDIEHLRTTDFRFLLENEMIVYVDQHHYVCSTRTGEVLASNKEQLQGACT
ncbi:TPA: hypothetical protein JLC50_004703 [Escherichia coli]|nr:hypothetical protein [Escherichia coli]